MSPFSLRLPILVLAVVGSAATGCRSRGADLEPRFQRVLNRGIEKHDVRGASAAVAFPDGRIWAGAAGFSHGSVPMTADLLFGIGSVTKNIIASLTLQLAEEGTISLDDPIGAYLPPYPHVDRTITVRQLLNHTSGLYMFWDNNALWEALRADRARLWAPEEVLAYIEEPYFAPGEGWRYSNTNYLLLGMILERVTGSTLAEELRRRFWEPLGLEAFLSVQEDIPDRMAHVFGDDFQFGSSEHDVTYEPRTAHESIIFGSGGLFMTAESLARWSRALFGGELIEPESMGAMLGFVSFRPVANMRAYGLGVQRFERRFSSGAEAIGHGGGNIGSATYMAYLPEHGVSVVVMVNAYPTRCADTIAKGLIREVLRERGVLGPLPYVPLFPGGVALCLLAAALGAAVLLYLKGRRAV